MKKYKYKLSNKNKIQEQSTMGTFRGVEFNDDVMDQIISHLHENPNESIEVLGELNIKQLFELAKKIDFPLIKTSSKETIIEQLRTFFGARKMWNNVVKGK